MDQKTIEQKLEELNREFDRKRCELAREYVARLAALGLTVKHHVIVPTPRYGCEEPVFHTLPGLWSSFFVKLDEMVKNTYYVIVTVTDSAGRKRTHLIPFDTEGSGINIQPGPIMEDETNPSISDHDAVGFKFPLEGIGK